MSAAAFYEFLSTTARGIASERRAPPGATIKLRETFEAERRSPREVRVVSVYRKTITPAIGGALSWRAIIFPQHTAKAPRL